jgi:hypothetical protein
MTATEEIGEATAVDPLLSIEPRPTEDVPNAVSELVLPTTAKADEAMEKMKAIKAREAALEAEKAALHDQLKDKAQELIDGLDQDEGAELAEAESFFKTSKDRIKAEYAEKRNAIKAEYESYGVYDLEGLGHTQKPLANVLKLAEDILNTAKAKNWKTIYLTDIATELDVTSARAKTALKHLHPKATLNEKNGRWTTYSFNI